MLRTTDRSLLRRLGLYVAWAVAVLASTWVLMRARLPHAALATGGVGLLIGVGLLSIGELRRWAERRRSPRPLAFAIRVWAAGSAAWVAYVLAVSLPLALFTDVPGTRRGQDTLALITFVPIPIVYALAWLIIWRRWGRDQAP